jgi:hypothetical protein
MQRLHLHISVPELESAIGFYSTLFDAAPAIIKDDYAKWTLSDPAVNLAISARGRPSGIDHVGVEVDGVEGLAAIAGRLKAAGSTTLDQQDTSCCYARSDKSWVTDTAGVRWETFFTHGNSTSYGEDEKLPEQAASSCCPSTAKTEAACC